MARDVIIYPSGTTSNPNPHIVFVSPTNRVQLNVVTGSQGSMLQVSGDTNSNAITIDPTSGITTTDFSINQALYVKGIYAVSKGGDWEGNRTGIAGNQGAQGNQGFKGNTGNQGAQGGLGFKGNKGNQGAQGFLGNQGNQGNKGAQGGQGGTGSQGFKGNTGAAGAQGNQGGQGVGGFQGA